MYGYCSYFSHVCTIDDTIFFWEKNFFHEKKTTKKNLASNFLSFAYFFYIERRLHTHRH